MSSASKSATIKFIPKMGTFTPSIQSPDGDIYQEYQRNGDAVTRLSGFLADAAEAVLRCHLIENSRRHQYTNLHEVLLQ